MTNKYKKNKALILRFTFYFVLIVNIKIVNIKVVVTLTYSCRVTTYSDYFDKVEKIILSPLYPVRCSPLLSFR